MQKTITWGGGHPCKVQNLTALWSHVEKLLLRFPQATETTLPQVPHFQPHMLTCIYNFY
jgi:hypothetical protein